MSNVYAQFDPFVSSWRSLRPDIVLRITLLRAGAAVAGDADELHALLKGIDKIIEALRKGDVAPLSSVYACCRAVRTRCSGDELRDRIWVLSAAYKHALLFTRPLPPSP